MFGKNAGSRGLVGGIIVTLVQGLIAKRVAGRAAGLAVRGGGGIPGLLMWLVIGHFVKKYLNSRKSTPAANVARRAAARV